MYLNRLPLSDSTFYFKAKFNLQYPNDSLFLNNYSKSKMLCRADTQLNKTASAYFLKGDNAKTKAIWFNQDAKNSGSLQNGFYQSYQASLRPDLFVREQFPEELQKPFSKYKSAYCKKPLLAAGMSMLLPGSGKLYAGKTKTFLLTFILSASYAMQTIESSQKLGIRHPLTFINAGAFTVFYLSNIYGSYQSVKELRRERKKQFLNDAANFYN